MDFSRGLDINAAAVSEALIRFIQEELSRIGYARLVAGVSGGVDSAVVTYLSVKAVGKANVVGIIMPYKTSSRENMQDAEEVIKRTGIKKYVVDISSQVDSYFELFPEADNVRRGNKMARERMSVLYDISALEKALVIGTSNKSEMLLGYGTIFGDLACALNPIGNLYKTQVWALADYLEIPKRIIAKAPSADLYVGQSDEGEFGFTYEEVDQLLYLLFDKKYTPEQCREAGFSRQMTARVMEMANRNSFKGRPPVIADLAKILDRSPEKNPRERGK